MNNNNKPYGEVKFSSTGDLYHFPLLSLRDKRNLIQRTASILAPALGSGADMYNEIKQQEETKALYEEEGLLPPEGEGLGMFSLSAVIGKQLSNPEVSDILDKLSEGWQKNSKPYDIDNEFESSEFDKYTAVLTESFKENILNPLTTRLREMGYSEILGLAQTVLTTRMKD